MLIVPFRAGVYTSASDQQPAYVISKLFFSFFFRLYFFLPSCAVKLCVCLCVGKAKKQKKKKKKNALVRLPTGKGRTGSIRSRAAATQYSSTQEQANDSF